MTPGTTPTTPCSAQLPEAATASSTHAQMGKMGRRANECVCGVNCIHAQTNGRMGRRVNECVCLGTARLQLFFACLTCQGRGVDAAVARPVLLQIVHRHLGGGGKHVKKMNDTSAP